ncbi:MAG: hypothetical protein ABI221_02365 [Candidatus Saccharimonadales bacterium]
MISVIGASAGLLLVPAMASAATATTTITSTIGAGINLLTSSGTVDISAVPNGAGVQTIAKDIVTVSTNDSAGYTLVLGESTATSTLTSGSNTIPGSAGTQTTPIVMANNTWGYRVDTVGGFGGGPTTAATNAAVSGSIKFAGVPATASPNTLKTTATTASNDVTNVWYGVAVTTAQASGTYTNSVTYTATAN